MEALKQQYHIVMTERFETEGPKHYESWKCVITGEFHSSYPLLLSAACLTPTYAFTVESVTQHDLQPLVKSTFKLSGLGDRKGEARDNAVERFIQAIRRLQQGLQSGRPTEGADV